MRERHRRETTPHLSLVRWTSTQGFPFLQRGRAERRRKSFARLGLSSAGSKRPKIQPVGKALSCPDASRLAEGFHSFFLPLRRQGPKHLGAVSPVVLQRHSAPRRFFALAMPPRFLGEAGAPHTHIYTLKIPRRFNPLKTNRPFQRQKSLLRFLKN